MAFILGPHTPALRVLREVPERFELRNGLIVVAWARRSGVGLLYSVLSDHLRSVDIVVGMASSGTSAEALGHLRTLFRRTYVYHKHHRQTFHPKIYLFDDGGTPPEDALLVVGSSNLTGGGLFQNIEGNLALYLQPTRKLEDRDIYNSVIQEVKGLVASPFCEELATNERIYELLEDGYISTEAALDQKRAREGAGAARRGQRRQQPEAPPPPLPQFTLPPLEVTFRQVEEEAAPSPLATTERRLAAADPAEQFYVRTLTVNDVNKLRGRTPGTAEWDIGESARDAMPEFWGWPKRYQLVVRRRTRLEWATKGVLRSSATSSTGVEVDIVLWHREPRPSHAAEHRLRIGPGPTLTAATPDHFNTTSLVVIEQLPAGKNHTFLVQLVTDNDAEYEDYARYLQHDRPQHRYGYGP